MAAPRTQLTRFFRAAFQSKQASTSSYNALSKSLPSLFARRMTTETASTPDAPADLPPPTPPATAAAEPDSVPAQPESYKALLSKDRKPKKSDTRSPCKQQERQVTATDVKITRKYGRVISAGRMDKTVRVEYTHTVYDKHIRRPFPAKTRLMVADLTNSCREGDVIRFGNGWRASKNVHHVVEKIIAPFGTPIKDRPKVPMRSKLERTKKWKMLGGEGAKIGKTKAKVLRRMEAEKERLAKVAEAEAKKAKLLQETGKRRKIQTGETETAKKELGNENWMKEERAIMEKALKSMHLK